MSTRTFLVSRKTMQCVEVAASSGFAVSASQEPKALALFCHAHRGEQIDMLQDGQLEAMNLCHGELTEWTDAKAALQYQALTGQEPPEYD